MVVVVAGNDSRCVDRELTDALEHVLGRVWGEITNQFVVDRQVRREHKEVVDLMPQMQIGNEGAHQSGLAHAGGQRKAQRREIALEVLQGRELRLEGIEDGRYILLMFQHFRRCAQRFCQPG
ncbi:hypothetical protein D3C75_916590 [compost metagenome]